MLEEKGEWDVLIILLVSSFLIWVFIFLIMDGGICWYFCLNGVGLDNFIWCWILFVVLMLVVFVEKIFWYLFIRFLYLFVFLFVSRLLMLILFKIFFSLLGIELVDGNFVR